MLQTKKKKYNTSLLTIFKNTMLTRNSGNKGPEMRCYVRGPGIRREDEKGDKSNSWDQELLHELIIYEKE